MAMSQKSQGFDVHVEHADGDVKFVCPEDLSILSAMEKAGLAVVPVGCRGGGCGICKISIKSGAFKSGKMSKAHISDDEIKSASVSLACRTYPQSAIIIKPLGKVFKHFQRTKSPINSSVVFSQGG